MRFWDPMQQQQLDVGCVLISGYEVGSVLGRGEASLADLPSTCRELFPEIRDPTISLQTRAFAWRAYGGSGREVM